MSDIRNAQDLFNDHRPPAPKDWAHVLERYVANQVEAKGRLLANGNRITINHPNYRDTRWSHKVWLDALEALCMTLEQLGYEAEPGPRDTLLVSISPNILDYLTGEGRAVNSTG